MQKWGFAVLEKTVRSSLGAGGFFVKSGEAVVNAVGGKSPRVKLLAVVCEPGAGRRGWWRFSSPWGQSTGADQERSAAGRLVEWGQSAADSPGQPGHVGQERRRLYVGARLRLQGWNVLFLFSASQRHRLEPNDGSACARHDQYHPTDRWQRRGKCRLYFN